MSFLPATDPLSIRQNVYRLFVSFVSIHIDIVFTKYIDTRIIINQNYEFWNYLLVIDTSLSLIYDDGDEAMEIYNRRHKNTTF